MSPEDDAPAPLDVLLQAAESQLWTDFEKTKVFSHSGVKGSGREGAVAKFLQSHLPERFQLTSGQVIDTKGNRTGQLDLIVYDRHLSAPLLKGDDGSDLMPAEALVAVVEVKTKFTRAEAQTCAGAAASIARLKPYGRSFIPARTAGAPADDQRCRCHYSVFAFSSDLGRKDWAVEEWKRLQAAAESKTVDVSRIDRLTVLDRGLIVPPTATARVAEDGKGILRDWFLHLTDFLSREASRREPYDWHQYGRRSGKGEWLKLEGYQPAGKKAKKSPSQPSKGKRRTGSKKPARGPRRSR